MTEAHSADLSRRLAIVAWLILSVVWGAWIRIDTALADPNFDAENAEGMLRSDPALLYYLTERIQGSLEAGHPTPADFSADPRIQHPFLTDVPREFPVGQEFLVAGAAVLHRRTTGHQLPLHRVALAVMGVVSALFVLGLFLLVRSVTSSDLWASLAVLLALLTPANYRTIGFLFVGEDTSLPLFVLHLGWLARASRKGGALAYLMSGVLGAAALATWHAASFLVTLELGVLVLGTLFTGRSPLDSRWAWLALLPPAAAGFVVPVLQASGWLFSPASALCLTLLAPVLVHRRVEMTPGRVRLLVAALAPLAILALGGMAPDAYAHVHQVVWAKLRFLGRFPEDPETLSFDARLLWQGPFETLPLSDLLAWLGWPLALMAGTALLARLRWRPTSGFESFLLGLLVVALPVAWMFARLSVLVGLLAPPLVAMALASWPRRGLALSLFGVLSLAQASLFTGFIRDHRIAWYLPAPAREELSSLIRFVRENVPPEEPILGDFVNSTALLAHTGNPIVLQPKYETDQSRRQAEAFLTTFFHGTTADLGELMRQRFRCRYLLVDGHVLWGLSRATAGLGPGVREPPLGTAAADLLTAEASTLSQVPELELMYRSPAGIAGADYRLFRLRP